MSSDELWAKLKKAAANAKGTNKEINLKTIRNGEIIPDALKEFLKKAYKKYASSSAILENTFLEKLADRLENTASQYQQYQQEWCDQQYQTKGQMHTLAQMKMMPNQTV